MLPEYGVDTTSSWCEDGLVFMSCDGEGQGGLLRHCRRSERCGTCTLDRQNPAGVPLPVWFLKRTHRVGPPMTLLRGCVLLTGNFVEPICRKKPSHNKRSSAMHLVRFNFFLSLPNSSITYLSEGVVAGEPHIDTLRPHTALSRRTSAGGTGSHCRR